MVSTTTLPIAPPGELARPGAAHLRVLRGARAEQVDHRPLDCSVVHQLPGRVRLRVPLLKTQPGLGQRLCGLLARQPGIRSVRANPACAALVVTFDPARLGVAEIVAWVSWAGPAAAPRLGLVEAHRSPAASQADPAILAICAELSRRVAGDLLEELRRSVTPSDLLDLVLSAIRGQLGPAVAALAVLLLVRAARSAIARRLRTANDLSPSARSQPPLQVVRSPVGTTGGAACAA